jgi:hypothetical protein
MTEEEKRNLHIAQELDDEKFGIPLDDKVVTLRDILTALYYTQAADTRWISKWFGKLRVSTDEVTWELPFVLEKAVRGKGEWDKYHLIVQNRLLELTRLGLADCKIKYSRLFERYMYNYGVTTLGKAFVNYK